jgi:amidase
MVPLAHGNDGGGSIRIPAACCGLVGLKPSRGRVSLGPDSGESFLVADGVLTRTVAETAELLDVLAGYETGDSTWAPPPDGAYANAAALAPGPVDIGLALNPPLAGATLDPVCEQAARDAAALLEALGHRVREITPPWSSVELLPDFSRLFGPLVSTTTWLGGRLAGREPEPDDVEPLTWELWERARAQDVIGFLTAQTRLQSVARSLVRFLAPYDAVLTPALAQRPLATGEVHGRGPEPWDHFRRSGLFTPYTAICNVIGLPAVSLPLYQGDDGLPAAVQVIGRPAGEDALLALAAQLETASPWAQRRPALALA